MDSLQLLAQEDLPLSLAQLLLDLGADLLLRLEHADLALQVEEQLPKPVFDRKGLEQFLLLLRLELGVEGYQIRQLAGGRDAAEQMVHDLLRDAAQTAELGGPLPHLLVQRGER